MAKITMQTGYGQTQNNNFGERSFDPIESGTYNAVVKVAEFRDVNKEICWWKEEDQEFVFRFKITDGEYEKREFFFDARPELTDSPKCRLRLIIESLLQVNKIPDDFELDVDDLSVFEGRLARIRIEKYQKKDGSWGNKITDVLPSFGPATANIDNVSFSPPPAQNVQPVAPVAPSYDDIPF